MDLGEGRAPNSKVGAPGEPSTWRMDSGGFLDVWCFVWNEIGVGDGLAGVFLKGQGGHPRRILEGRRLKSLRWFWCISIELVTGILLFVLNPWLKGVDGSTECKWGLVLTSIKNWY